MRDGCDVIMKRILILGGAGFLGKNLCGFLLEKGYDVTVYNRNSHNIDIVKSLFPTAQIHVSEFQNESNWEKILDNIDIVFHLISDSNPANKNVSSEFSHNVIPTISLLEKIKDTNIKIVFFSSGGTVYGIPKSLPIYESHPTDPISPYGIQKLCIEKIIEYYGRTYGVDYRILRISNPYGAYQNPNSNQGVVAVFMAKMLQNQKIQIWGNGSIIRDYLYVSDLLDACKKIIEYEGCRRIFNISSGVGISLNEIVDMIQHRLNCIADVEYISGRVHDVSANILGNSLAENELNWRPKVDIVTGINCMALMWNKRKKNFWDI